MADAKISALPASTTPLVGTEVLPIVQSGATKQVSIANVTAGRAVSATSLALNGAASALTPAFIRGGEFSCSSFGADKQLATFGAYNDDLTNGGFVLKSLIADVPTEIARGGFYGLTVNRGNLIIGTSGAGIDFSADGQAAGMTSELLDDYEEGTWTPTFIGSGGNPTVTFTTQLGSYTKAGRLVFIKLDILVNSTSGGSGNLSVGGLPFVNSAINSGLSNAFVFNFVVSPLNYHVVSGSDSIALFQDTITNTPSTVADLQASAFLRISGCYSV